MSRTARRSVQRQRAFNRMYARLCEKLGRKPTEAELHAEQVRLRGKLQAIADVVISKRRER